MSLHASHAIAQLRSGFAGNGRDFHHQSRQHARAVAQQTAVGR
jgi:hypothetical protein